MGVVDEKKLVMVVKASMADEDDVKRRGRIFSGLGWLGRRRKAMKTLLEDYVSTLTPVFIPFG